MAPYKAIYSPAPVSGHQSTADLANNNRNAWTRTVYYSLIDKRGAIGEISVLPAFPSPGKLDFSLALFSRRFLPDPLGAHSGVPGAP